ncbi:MAG: hypothetical protein N2117_11290 [Anaerolineales bacterium]|nr:hypothetical protein [Anaerolineales bacterium]
METGDFHGWPTLFLENRFLRLECLAASPRIVRLFPFGKPNLFADLGNEFNETPYGRFYFRGGHRLWHSPEAMPRTYIPDNEGAIVSELPGGLRIEQPAEPWTHIAKSIEIRLNDSQPQVIVYHELRNDGPWPVEFAPWALTMFRLGGLGIFPLPVGNADPEGLLPNRQLVFWPYTRIQDLRLTVRDDFILLRASGGLPPVKVGYFNPHGWQAYALDDVLFIKCFDPCPGAHFPDGGCNTETYTNHQFIELETLAPLVKLGPGETVTHTETWELHEGISHPLIPSDITSLMTRN